MLLVLVKLLFVFVILFCFREMEILVLLGSTPMNLAPPPPLFLVFCRERMGMWRSFGFLMVVSSCFAAVLFG
jgi:hypothetical protein